MENIKKIKLEDAHALSLLYPNSFFIPSEEELKALKVGNTIKVSAFGERFWVVISEIQSNKLICKIDNHLVCADHESLHLGDFIEVSFNNIYSIYES